jgi:hypothetical protein
VRRLHHQYSAGGGGSLRSLSGCGWALQRFESRGFETVLVPPAPHVCHARATMCTLPLWPLVIVIGNADDEKAASDGEVLEGQHAVQQSSMLYSKAAGTHPLSRTIETLEPD